MKDVIQIAAFLKRHLPRGASWEREKLLMWLSWHSGRGNVAVVEKDGKIFAAAVARPITTALDSRSRYCVNENGPIVYVEAVVAKTAESFREMIAIFRRRFPNQTRILFTRAKQRHLLRSYPVNAFLRKVRVYTNPIESKG